MAKLALFAKASEATRAANEIIAAEVSAREAKSARLKAARSAAEHVEEGRPAKNPRSLSASTATPKVRLKNKHRPN